jgi:hypothetical protein
MSDAKKLAVLKALPSAPNRPSLPGSAWQRLLLLTSSQFLLGVKKLCSGALLKAFVLRQSKNWGKANISAV